METELSQRFIVLLPDINIVEEVKFLKYLADEGYNYWHHFPHVFLVKKKENPIELSAFSKNLQSIFGNSRHLVFEINDEGKRSWSGFGPVGYDEKSMFSWLKEIWSK